MTSRQTGRRGVAARYRKQGKRMKPAGKQEAMRPRERRQMLQFLACGSLFVILVAVKLLLPGKMTAFNERLTAAMERNMDVQGKLVGEFPFLLHKLPDFLVIPEFVLHEGFGCQGICGVGVMMVEQSGFVYVFTGHGKHPFCFFAAFCGSF